MAMQSDPNEHKMVREQSTIQFPYIDLDEAVRVVKAMHDRGGGVPMERDQVAAATNSAGGTFANKLSAAKQFGLIDSVQGKWSLTPLGYEVLEPTRERASKAAAFLNVELYRRTYEEYRGRPLPVKNGLEYAFTTFGVAAKQKEKARQTFERSARTAGFFPNGSEDRLVQPVVGQAPQREAEEIVIDAPVFHGSHRSQPATPPEHHHAFIVGLLERLPPIETEWEVERRAKWLQAAAQIFDLLYTGAEGTVVVEVKASTK